MIHVPATSRRPAVLVSVGHRDAGRDEHPAPSSATNGEARDEQPHRGQRQRQHRADDAEGGDMQRRAEPEDRDGIDVEREGIAPPAEIEEGFGAEISGCVDRRERRPPKTKVVLAHTAPKSLKGLGSLLPRQS